MEEKRLECLTMLQIHRSDTPSIDAVIDRFATTAARRLNFLIRTYYTCTSVRCTVEWSFLYRHYKYIIP